MLIYFMKEVFIVKEEIAKMEEQQYGYWILNTDATSITDGKMRVVCNCSACGHEVVEEEPSICPECSAIMVDPLDITDIDGRDICAGDVVLCDIKGHSGKVQGTVVHDAQWYFDNPIGFRWIYNCDNFEIVEGAIPKGKSICRNYGNNKERR